ncbi:MAG: CinA family protein [Chloroflexota bacterium]
MKSEQALTKEAARVLRERCLTVAVAEGTTGGRIGERLTRYPGATAFFKGAVATYDYSSRTSLLGITQALLIEHGSVSEPVVRAMAEAVRERFGSTIGLASSGVAGPRGKDVGRCWLAIAGPNWSMTRLVREPVGTRLALQAAFTRHSLALLVEAASRD